LKGEHTLDEVKLQAYLDRHLAREVEMLRWTGSFLKAFTTLSSEKISGEISEAFQQSSLESFASHARNLIDFLYLKNHYRKDRPTDVVIEDFVSKDVVDQHLIPITEMLLDARIKANKLVAHLAVERETFGFYQRAWMYSQIAPQIFEALKSIVYKIPDNLQSDRLTSAISDSLPLFFDIRLRQHSENDERGPGFAMEFGMWYRPDEYGHA